MISPLVRTTTLCDPSFKENIGPSDYHIRNHEGVGKGSTWLSTDIADPISGTASADHVPAFDASFRRLEE